MKNFRRSNIYFSLCGLNCGLCSMRLSNHCPGCGGGEQHSCRIAKCSLEHDGIEYCFLCGAFPCAKYENADQFDSFITHKHQFSDMHKAQVIGVDAYTAEQIEKVHILNHLLENYNIGRQKTFFCLAVNLLNIQDIRVIMDNLASSPEVKSLDAKSRAIYAVNQFQALADTQKVLLKLRKMPPENKLP